MSSITPRDWVTEGRSRSTHRPPRSRVLMWLLVPLLLLAAMSALLYLYARTHGPVAASTLPSNGAQASTAAMQPADRFMQSIVTEDGALGWHQLCPNIQAGLPLEVLVQQADAQRAAAKQQGVWLTMEFAGTHPQRGGGDVHVYQVTAHWPNGVTQQRTFSVFTQPSGCVEDVQNQ